MHVHISFPGNGWALWPGRQLAPNPGPRAHSGGEAEAGGNQGENVGGLHFDSRNWGQKGIRETYSWIF